MTTAFLHVCKLFIQALSEGITLNSPIKFHFLCNTQL